LLWPAAPVYATGYSKFSGAIDHVVAQYQVASGASVYAEGAWAMTEGFGFSMTYTVNLKMPRRISTLPVD